MGIKETLAATDLIMTETGLIETAESEVISATACGQTKMETSANQIDNTTPDNIPCLWNFKVLTKGKITKMGNRIQIKDGIRLGQGNKNIQQF